MKPDIASSRLFFLCCLAALSACGKHEQPASASVKPVPVTVARVQPADGGSQIIASGTLARQRELVLSFRVPGVLRMLSVDNGDNVRAGAVIARIDPTQFDARQMQAQADLAKAQRDLARDKPLAAQGWISQARLADRETAVTMARATLDSARFDQRWTSLLAPTNGIVLKRHVQSGEVVQPGTPVVTIGDARAALVLRTSLADRERLQVKLGQVATVTISALGNEAFSGTVSRLDAASDPRTGAFIAEIRLPNDPRLKTGFIGDAILAVAGGDAAGNLVRVPAEALFEVKQGIGFVYGLSADRKAARKQQVRFAGFDGDDALIEGPAIGARVITAGGAFITNGSAITVAGQD
jgi:membrane fusion protein, multidrug efflux system